MEAIWLKRRPLLSSTASGSRPKGAIPLRPWKRESSNSGTFKPMGVTQPRPVMTTRFNRVELLGKWEIRLLEQLADGCGGLDGGGLTQAHHSIDDIADGPQAAQGFVGDGDAEDLFDL